MKRDYLMHYGVKGMKWGRRRTPAQLGYNPADSSVTKRVKNDYNRMSDDEFKRKYRTEKKTYAKRVEKYGDPYMNSPLAKTGKKLNAMQRERQQNKNLKKQILDANIKDYRRKFDEAEKASNIADEKWNEVSEQYKSLGKTRVTRMINAARNKTDAAKAYNKNYDKASELGDIADAKWREANRAYIKTGRNRVEAIVNNISYDMRKRKR